ncbi:MAG: arginase [Candidatus Wallbacteria bacterium]|nr:arginase [Candidatus Wallbacteria bacterium]
MDTTARLKRRAGSPALAAHLLPLPGTQVSAKPVTVIGMPLDLGADRRGVDMGPSAIRYAGLKHELERIGIAVEDLGNVNIPSPESHPPRNARAKYAEEIVRACRRLARMVSQAIERDRVAVVLGGDHSLAMGSIVGASRCHDKLGLLWFDAHADFNTPRTSPSGNVHGMPLAAVFQYGSPAMRALCKGSNVDAKRCALVGVRDTDEGERLLLKKAGLKVFTMEAIDRYGLQTVMRQAIETASHGGTPFHVSFDVDVLDPGAAPGVGTPAIGGLTYRESLLAMEMISETAGLTSVDMVEVNPILDHQNITAKIVVNLLATLLGRRVL